MNKGIDPDLFAALMRLSARERADFLEFLGQSPVAASDCLLSPDWWTRGMQDRDCEPLAMATP